MQITSASYVWPSSHLLFLWSRGNVPTDEMNRFYHTEKSFTAASAAAAMRLWVLNIQVTHEQTWSRISSAFYSQGNRKKTFHPTVHPDIDQKGKNQSACVFLRRTIS